MVTEDQVFLPGQELCPLLLVTTSQFFSGNLLFPTISPGGLSEAEPLPSSHGEHVTLV